MSLGQYAQRGGFIRLFAVEGFDTYADSSFDSFGGNDAFSGFAESYSEASPTLSASDKAVVVEGDVANRLMFYAAGPNGGPQYSEQYTEPQPGQYYDQSYGQNYGQDQYFQGGQ